MDSSRPTPAVPAPLLDWLAAAVEYGASDLHLVRGYPPVLRVHGDLTELPAPPVEDTHALLSAICPAHFAGRLRDGGDVDFALDLEVGGRRQRFRVNLFHAGRVPAGCLRVVPPAIPSFAWAEFPAEVGERLASLRDGLVVVGGATGTGKSTTLAMVVNRINAAGGCRILTVEDPVEYTFPHSPGSVVTQREVGADVPTFADGLRSGLRQDPDVILVGEIRDRETAQMAMTAAETGHLVFTTLHARDAKGVVTRYADLFPQDVQRDVRGQLALSLRAVIAQRLLPDVTRGAKRHLAVEVLWNTHPVAAAIRQGKVESIDNCLLTGRADGMVGFDEAVRRLFQGGLISQEVAERNVSDPAALWR
jgi:twitching motility protein PilT